MSKLSTGSHNAVSSGQINGIMDKYLPHTALGEVKVSQSQHIVYATFDYALEPRVVVNSGIGTHTETIVSGMAKLTTGTNTTDRSVLRTRLPLRYIPSQGIEANMTASFTSGAGSQIQLLGAIDDANGYAFGMSGSTGGLYWRSFGATTFIPQSGWNQNTLLGSHDWSMGNAYRIETQSHGFSMVNCSIEDQDTGFYIPVHQFYHANRRVSPDVASPATKLRAEINNNGAAAAATMYVVQMDGRTQGTIGKTLPGGVSGTGFTATSGTHILTLRNKTSYYGLENQRIITMKHLHMNVDGGADSFIDCYLNLAVSGTSFSDVNTEGSICDISSEGQLPVTLSGAIDGCIAMRNTAMTHDFVEIELAPGDTLTFVSRKFGGSNAVPVNIYTSWNQNY